jgi:vacuolar-type H+-ATPase subunit D/Vma8
MTTVTATRSELLARRTREGIARRGHALLTQKRAALIGELRGSGSRSAASRPGWSGPRPGPPSAKPW